MPELPDVEVLRRYLDSTALHRKIATVHVREQRVLEIAPSTLRRHLLGNALGETRRHGKLLFSSIDGDDRSLLLHFGMTGWLEYYEDGEAPDDTALLLDFEDGSHLAYENARTFGQVDLVDDVDGWLERHDQGPDPLAGDFDLRTFRDALDGRRGSLKGTLMDQSVLAGIGNVYADEILYQTGFDPESDTASLDGDQVEALYRTMNRVIDKAIEVQVDKDAMPGDWLLPIREDGAGCPRCDGKIARKEVVGRPTYWCPSCQSKPG